MHMCLPNPSKRMYIYIPSAKIIVISFEEKENKRKWQNYILAFLLRLQHMIAKLLNQIWLGYSRISQLKKHFIWFNVAKLLTVAQNNEYKKQEDHITRLSGPMGIQLTSFHYRLLLIYSLRAYPDKNCKSRLKWYTFPEPVILSLYQAKISYFEHLPFTVKYSPLIPKPCTRSKSM